MNRKNFIGSTGATCRNWAWSWSFVNHQERIIIFGAWDTAKSGDRILILKDSWYLSNRGRKQPAYGQSLEHINLIKNDGYKLKTFPIIYSSKNEGMMA